MPSSMFTDQSQKIIPTNTSSFAKSKTGEKGPTLHNLNHIGKRQSRTLTKNLDVQCSGQTSLHSLYIPNELWPFSHFLSCNIELSPICIGFGFLQPIQLPCTTSPSNSISYLLTGQGTDSKRIFSLKNIYPIPPSTTLSHSSPVEPIEFFPFPLSFWG